MSEQSRFVLEPGNYTKTMVTVSESSASESWASSMHVYALLCAVVVVPLANYPDHLLWFDITPKVAALILTVGLACVTIQSDHLDHAIGGKYAATAIPLAMIAIAVLSTAFSRTPVLSLGGSNWRRVGLPAEISLAVFIILQTEALRNKPRYVIWCLRASCVALLISSIAVLLEFEGAAPLLGLRESPNVARPGGVLGSGAAFGCYATAPLFLCAALWMMDQAWFWRRIATLAGILGFVAILVSGTRAAVLAVFVGLLVSVALMKQRSTRLIVGVCFTLATAAVGLAFSDHTPFSKRLEQIDVDPWGSTRLYVWGDSLGLLSAMPTFGYGLESFPRIYPTIQTEQTALRWPGAFHESAHSYLIDTVLSKGVIGIAIVLALSVSAFITFRQLPTETKPPYVFCVAGHVACLSSCVFFTPQLPTLLYMYLPVCLLWATRADRGRTLQVAAEDLIVASPPRISVSRTLLVRCLGTVFLVYAAYLVMWDSHVYEAKVLFDSGQINAAVDQFVRARRIAPPGVTAEGWFARELIRSIQRSPSQSLDPLLYESLNISIQHEEEFENSTVLLAAKMISDGRTHEAESVLRQAAHAYPNWPIPRSIFSTLELNTSGVGDR
jgi:O-antigen ligase